MDGSHHEVMVDDATGKVDARFFENASWASAAEMFHGYVLTNGLPRGLYVDRHGIYRAEREQTFEELAAGIVPETQFGRALRQLDVELILARSPQANRTTTKEAEE